MQRIPDPQQTLPSALIHVHDHDPGPDRFAEGVIEGLSRTDKALPFRFLYDEAGSRLFDRICQQPEYYPTRTEMQILEQHAGDIADLAGPGARLIELGSGAGRKIGTLLDALEAPAAYIPVDISRGILLSAARQVAINYPGLPVHAVWADFSQPFGLPLTGKGRAIGFFPGSSIGNFTRVGARRFLATWKDRLGPGAGMIVGVDLIKPVPVLEAAYNDEAGITAAFSLNILRRMNRELGGDFKLENFRHDARYNPRSQAIDIHLISEVRQNVTVSGQKIRFDRDEKLHLESSHKYDAESFADLAAEAGFRSAAVWTDPKRLFSVHFLAVPQSGG
ncbi:MAG: L-histidine N(alpha)-methyltransferase [Hyphomonas sp.]